MPRPLPNLGPNSHHPESRRRNRGQSKPAGKWGKCRVIIIFLIPLALRGVKFKALSAGDVLQRNLLVYGLGGQIVPFVGIKAIDLIVYNLFHLV